MPRKAKEVCTKQIRRLGCAVGKDGKPYNTFYAVGGVAGVVRQVTPTGARTWLLRIRVGTRVRARLESV